jgi:hypothetical protein
MGNCLAQPGAIAAPPGAIAEGKDKPRPGASGSGAPGASGSASGRRAAGLPLPAVRLGANMGAPGGTGRTTTGRTTMKQEADTEATPGPDGSHSNKQAREKGQERKEGKRRERRGE